MACRVFLNWFISSKLPWEERQPFSLGMSGPSRGEASALLTGAESPSASELNSTQQTLTGPCHVPVSGLGIIELKELPSRSS